MSTMRLMTAEALGTAWLVLGGCGAAVLATSMGIGYLGVALAFGFALVTATFAFGHVSGGHFNPAVTLGLVAAGKFCSSRAFSYIVAQIVGALIGAAIVYYIAGGKAGFDVTAGFASNGFGEHSPGGYSQHAVFVTEAVLTFFFVTIFMHVTHGSMPAGLSALPIGLSFALVYLVSMGISGGGANPARSIGTAVFQGTWAIDQLWLFIAAPLVGAVVAGWLKKSMCCGGECGASTTSCSTEKGSCSK